MGAIDIKYFICLTGVQVPECGKIQDAYIITSLAIWIPLVLVACHMFYRTLRVPRDAITPKINQQLLYFTYLIMALFRLGTFVAATMGWNFGRHHTTKVETPFVASDLIHSVLELLLFNLIIYSWTSTTHRIAYKTFHLWWMKYKRMLWCLVLVACIIAYTLCRLILAHDILLNWCIFQGIYLSALTFPSILFWMTISKLKKMLSVDNDPPRDSSYADPFLNSVHHNSPALHGQSLYLGNSSSEVSGFDHLGRLDSNFSAFNSASSHFEPGPFHNNSSRPQTHQLLANDRRSSDVASASVNRNNTTNAVRSRIISSLTKVAWAYLFIYLVYVLGIIAGLHKYGRFVYAASNLTYVIFLRFYQPEQFLLLDPTAEETHHSHETDYHPVHSHDTMLGRDEDTYLPPTHFNNRTPQVQGGYHQNQKDRYQNTSQPPIEESSTLALGAATQNIIDQQRLAQQQQRLALQQQNREKRHQQQQQQHQLQQQQQHQHQPTFNQNTSNFTPTFNQTPLLGGSPSMAVNMPNVPGGAFTKMQPSGRENNSYYLPGQSPISAGVGASLVESYLASQSGSALRSSTTSHMGNSLGDSTGASIIDSNTPQNSTGDQSMDYPANIIQNMPHAHAVPIQINANSTAVGSTYGRNPAQTYQPDSNSQHAQHGSQLPKSPQANNAFSYYKSTTGSYLQQQQIQQQQQSQAQSQSQSQQQQGSINGPNSLPHSPQAHSQNFAQQQQQQQQRSNSPARERERKPSQPQPTPQVPHSSFGPSSMQHQHQPQSQPQSFQAQQHSATQGPVSAFQVYQRQMASPQLQKNNSGLAQSLAKSNSGQRIALQGQGGSFHNAMNHPGSFSAGNHQQQTPLAGSLPQQGGNVVQGQTVQQQQQQQQKQGGKKKRR